MELSELQMKHLHLPKDHLEGMVALQLQSSGKDWRLFCGFKVSAPAIECQNHVQQPRDSQRQEIVQQPRLLFTGT